MATRYPRTPLTVNTFGRKTTHTQIHPTEPQEAMYAEERQQAIADLVAQRGRLSVNAARRRSTTSPPRPCAATSPSSSGLGLVRRVHGGAVPAELALPLIESGVRERDHVQHRREGADRPRPRRPAPRRPAARSCSTPGTTTVRLATLLPRDRQLTVVTHAVPIAARLAGSPQLDLHLLPGRVRPTTQAAVGADTVAALADLRVDVAFVGTNGLIRRPRPDHPRPRRGRRQAGDGRGARHQVVVLADASKIGSRDTRPVRRPRRRSTCVVTDDGIEPTPTVEALRPRTTSRSSIA